MTHQKYYTKEKHKECIEEMEEITDIYTVCDFCLMNMYKYSYRAGLKTKNKDIDLDKISWYSEYACKCIDKMNVFKKYIYKKKYNSVCIACSVVLGD